MRKLLKEVYDLLSGLAHKAFNKKPAEDTALRDAQQTVQVTACGNVALIAGHFVTVADMEREKAELGEAIFPPIELRRQRTFWPEQQAEERARARPIALKFRDRFRRGHH